MVSSKWIYNMTYMGKEKKAHEIECWFPEIYISDNVVVNHVRNQFSPSS